MDIKIWRLVTGNMTRALKLVLSGLYLMRCRIIISEALSSGLFCVAMVQLNDSGELAPAGKLPIRSEGMKLLEQIKQTNPNAAVRGAGGTCSIDDAGLTRR